MGVDLKELSPDELDLIVATRMVVDEVLGQGISAANRAAVARQLLPPVLSAYREARIAGLCHEGACELARDRARATAIEARHEA
ncbi:MAG: hypothetical protein R3C39_13265 [Dehalococcoidia bacterium]